ncbi:hypothetical protein FEM03_01255 [Phragmitibacter flavus]|uniref:Aminoacyl-tRNA synthetase class II (G/ P/ S/T) domain-containing protein n=1 Tax=Phragmitibacter flavus TaxID=2576071 RepID=A0A5R8KKG1_9BACT|nr:hypothetical protein [Phragmitibacter flavus]TLD72730.1 hypothetical protein FEM03_01255 [Phragmitibacter flavus]
MEQRWPVLMRSETLRRAGYFDSFPQLLMTASFCPDPENAPEIVAASGWCLSPAVCYHAYAGLEGQTLAKGVKLSASGSCFRHEEPTELQAGRRQVEFTMRELILVGAKDWIEHELTGVREEIHQLAIDYGLSGTWQPASDPFFLPKAKGKACAQKLLETKWEYCLRDGLAIASINRHGDFFGKRFSIRLPDGNPAHSACIAFGLERWASQSTISMKHHDHHH